MNDMETVVMSIEDELQEYISQLDLSRKKSLLKLIKSFVQMEGIRKLKSHKKSDLKLEDEKINYKTSDFITNENDSEEMDGPIGKPQTTEEYNNEIDEAITSIEAAIFILMKK